MTLIGATFLTRTHIGPEQVHLRLLATTDLHAHLMPYDYFVDRQGEGFGLARLADLIDAARSNAANTLLVDNGDTLEGTPLADTALSCILPSGTPNPMIVAMNTLGYDAATLGNHDFDFGLDYLETSLSRATFPIVVANANRPDGASFLAPRRIIEREVTDGAGRMHTLRIGVTGAVPPQVAAWSRRMVDGKLIFSDIRQAIAKQAAALRAEGADIVIALTHSGLGRIDAKPGAENVSRQVAADAGVDVVVAGHTHALSAYPKTATSAAIVQPAAFGTHLGVVDLIIDPVDEPSEPAPGTRWKVVNSQVATPAMPEIVKASGTAPPRRVLARYPDLRSVVARAHRSTRAHIAKPLGQSAIPLETLFSTLAPCAVTQLVADAQRAAVAPLLATRPDLASLPVLSAAAPFRAGGRAGPKSFTNIPAGALQLRNVADLYIYPNAICLLRMDGAGLVEWLERSVSIYNRILPQAEARQRLINHCFAPYNFDRITGLRYEIDLAQPARTDIDGDVHDPSANRIQNLRFADGRPVQPDDQMLIITNSYRASGGGNIMAAAEADTIPVSHGSVRDAIVRYIAGAAEPIAPKVEPTFTFKPLSGTPVIFETGPAAMDHPDRLAELGLRPMQNAPDPDGFMPFLLHL